MTNRRMELSLDELDWNTIQDEIARRQAISRQIFGKGLLEGPTVPEGESCLAGTVIAECIRDLTEYRDLWKAEH